MCPVCNGTSTVKWIAKRESELLPTPYFLLTFTIPAKLRPLFLINKHCCYSILFKAVKTVLLKGIANNNRSFHGIGGFFAVLHTWDQRRNYHPHLHIVIPAGCLSFEKTQWNPSPSTFLLPVKKLSKQFRNTILVSLRKKVQKNELTIPSSFDPLESVFDELNAIDWVVNSQAPGKKKSSPAAMIRYLARYVYKSAISDKQILKVEKGMVHLQYVDRSKMKVKTEIISEMVFLKRLAFHILPKGFKKVRFYGFMANRCRTQMISLCKIFLGLPVEQQQNNSGTYDDTAFLFWKYLFLM
jgi:hypothetical protein